MRREGRPKVRRFFRVSTGDWYVPSVERTIWTVCFEIHDLVSGTQNRL
ncbi:MAG: hypothetical protein ACYDBP_14995 [Leptospirales bacterium]